MELLPAMNREGIRPDRCEVCGLLAPPAASGGLCPHCGGQLGVPERTSPWRQRQEDRLAAKRDLWLREMARLLHRGA